MHATANAMRDSRRNGSDRAAHQRQKPVGAPAPRLTPHKVAQPDDSVGPTVRRACACGGGCPSCLAEPGAGQRQSAGPSSAHRHQSGVDSSRARTHDASAVHDAAGPADGHRLAGPGQRPLEPTAAAAVDAALAGPGKPLEPAARGDMQLRLGHDFSHVRVHADQQAAAANGRLNSQAFTLGRDIVFGRGQYAPGTATGRALLAHELAHVAQTSPTDVPSLAVGYEGSAWEAEASSIARRVMAGGAVPPVRERAPSIVHRNGGPIVSGTGPAASGSSGAGTGGASASPTAATPPGPFVEGRPAHNHPASPADWALVQADAQANCRSSPSRIDCICAHGSPSVVLMAASMFTLGGEAQTHFDHYESGGGADLDVSATLSRMLHTDAGARSPLAAAIASADRGHVFIQQTDYSEDEFKNAFGGIDRVDYLVDRATGEVHVWFKDRYDFHPVGFGYTNMGTGDVLRNTNCVHAAAVELKASGAADFWMFAYSVEPLSLFSGSSGGGGGGSID